MSILSNFKKIIVDFPCSEYFKYFSYLGAAYFTKVLIKLVRISIKNINCLTKLNLSDYDYEWVIFLDGSKKMVVEISKNLLNYNDKYKILLLGDDEPNLKLNFNLLKEKFKNREIEYIYRNKDKLKFKEEFFSKIKSNASIVFFNFDYRIQGTFHKFKDNEIREILNENYFRASETFDFLIKEIKQKNKILFIYPCNSYIKYKISSLQLYSSSKLLFRNKLKKEYQIVNSKFDFCFIEDFNFSNDTKLIKPSILNNKYLFLYSSNRIMHNLTKYSHFIKNIRKKNFLDKIKKEKLIN